MKKLFSLLFISLLMQPIFGQITLPNTDIHVYEMKEKNGKITISKGRNITNRAAYDNQPSFFNNDYILYTAYQKD